MWGAFPYEEVKSGYTAFFLGARSVCPTATMDVKYTNSWASFDLEKEAAEALIAGGCVLISSMPTPPARPRRAKRRACPSSATTSP